MTPLQDRISQSYLQPRARRPGAWALTFLSLCALTAPGCRAHECADLRYAFAQRSSGQGEKAPLPAPIVMSAQLHEDRLNTWWQEALDRAGRSLTWQERVQGAHLRGRLHLRRARISAVERPGAHATGLLLDWEATLDLSASLSGLTLFQGKTALSGQSDAPLRLEQRPRDTALHLSLADATLSRLSLDLPIPDAWRGPLNDFARDGLQAALRAIGPDLTLARWAPLRWEHASMTARPALLHTLDRSLWVGFSTDLPLPEGTPSLRPSSTLLPGEDVAVSFSGAALTGLLHLLLQRGLLPARLDDDFKPDPNGAHRVTLNRASPQDQRLDLDLTLWRLADDEDQTCYAAQVQARALFHVKQGGHVDLQLDDLQLISSQGEDTTLRLGLWWHSLFFEKTLRAQTSLLAASTLQLGPLGQQQLTARRVSSQPDLVSVALQLEPSP